MEKMFNLNPQGRCIHCGATVYYKDRRCPKCGRPNDNWVQPDKSYCGNCHARLEPGDKYCRICGTKAGEGPYAPYQDLMQCIYGPMPMERKHECTQCGYTWTTCLMVDKEKFCPQCGSNAKIVSTGNLKLRSAQDDDDSLDFKGIVK